MRISDWSSDVCSSDLFFLNFYFGNQRNAEENKAREYIAEIQVLSQQIAKFSAEAVSGGFEAFSELKSTRGRIETLVRNLLDGNPDDNVPAYQGQAGVGDPLQKLVDSWTPVNNSAQRIAEREELVLGLADTASEFSSQVPQLQAKTDEVVRQMMDTGSSRSQIDRKSVV